VLRDVEIPNRYLVVDRWESREAYNDFVEAHREEYMRRVDDTVFHHEHELRIGTFENVW
jgi:quinol monooxygenase YgiN